MPHSVCGSLPSALVFKRKQVQHLTCLNSRGITREQASLADQTLKLLTGPHRHEEPSHTSPPALVLVLMKQPQCIKGGDLGQPSIPECIAHKTASSSGNSSKAGSWSKLSECFCCCATKVSFKIFLGRI